MLAIDESTDFGARVARHLRADVVVWLTTVTAAGAPVPSPVWFCWDEQETVLVFSLDDTARIHNIEHNPRVSLNFPGDGKGGDIVVLSARATIARAAPPASQVPAYVGKYQPGFDRLSLTAEQFSHRYSVPIHIRLTRLRGH